MRPSTREELAACIEHTLLRPDATAKDIERLCHEARAHRFHAVCLHTSRLVLASHCLEGSGVRLVAVVGFPTGASDSDVKRYETELAIDSGADEVDTVINLGRLKDGDDRYVLRELRDIVAAAEERPVKVILETHLLTEAEVARACQWVRDAGAHYVKTSTGFTGGGATVGDVTRLRGLVGAQFGVKASGGIRDTAAALALIDAGANRIGTSSGVAILDGFAEAPVS